MKQPFRAFLNMPGHNSLAAISVEVDDFLFCSGLDIVISDCRKTITLEFPVGDEKGYENSLFKLDQLLKATQVAKAQLIRLRAKRIQEDEEETKENEKTS